MSTIEQPPGGVIFDLDGTLYYLKKTRVRLTLMLWRDVRIIRHVGAARRVIRERTFEDAEQLRVAFSEELGRRASIAPERAREWYERRFLDNFISLLDRSARPRPGLYPLLSRLRGAGIRLAVVSDISRVDERLRAIGISPEAFDLVLSAEEVGELKPSPRALLNVSQRWGLAPSRVVVMGDRIDRDARAASAAGMHPIIVDNHAPLFGARKKQGFTLLSWKEAKRSLLKHVGLE